MIHVLGSLSMIAAVTRNGIIGSSGAMPWHLPADLKYFKEKTAGHYIVMGRKTWESIGQVLPGRTTVILTRNPDYKPPAEGVLVAYSKEEVLDLIKDDPEPFIVGGAEIYQIFLPDADRLYITEIDAEIDGDVTFPRVDQTEWQEVNRENHPADEMNQFGYSFLVLERAPH